MKVKDSSNILNKKKNPLPSSKLLKPKKFKTSLKPSTDGKKHNLKSDKLNLVKESVKTELVSNSECILKKTSPKQTKSLKAVEKSLKKNASIVISPKETSISKRKSPKQKKSLKASDKLEKANALIAIGSQETKKSVKKIKSEKIQTLFDFVDSPPTQIKREVKREGSGKQSKDEKLQVLLPTKSNTGHIKIQTKLSSKATEDGMKKESTTCSVDKLKISKVTAVTEGLLKTINANASSKPEILDVGEPIFLQVECIKIPICPTKQLRFKLPHPLADDTSDVLLITSDLKGQKIYPDKAVEHYEEKFAELGINFINKVMPYRMIKKEYSQYEMRRKLVDQFDVILADSRIIKSLPAILGKFILYKRKMPIPVNLSISKVKLKKHLKDAVSKTQMTVKSSGHASLVQVGHSKMKAFEIAANILEVAKSLETQFPGGWKNVRCLMIKTALSTSLPVYLSLLSPNEVKIPVEVPRRPKPVEDELSTMPGFNVAVTHDGNVILKKVEEENKIDNTKDEEILEEAKKYMDSAKTVRYDESSDEENEKEKEGSDSEDEEEAITEAMEKKLLNKYEQAKAKKKAGKDDENDYDEEDDEESDDEDNDEDDILPIAPKAGKKRKAKETKKQNGTPAKKGSSAPAIKGKDKAHKVDKESKKNASPGFNKPQPRGSRGGKKTKMSKDQRKALIKRKKAGKK